MPTGQYQIWQDIAPVSVELEEDVSGVHWEILPLPQQSKKMYFWKEHLGVPRLVFLANKMQVM